MDSRKRTWIWAGLGLAAGVGVVLVASRTPTEPVPPPQLPPGTVPPGGIDPALPTAPQIAAPARVLPGSRVLLVGDSLAQGLAVPLKQITAGVPAALAVMAKQSTRILDWAGAPFPPADLVLVSLGTNDMRLSNPAAEMPKLKTLSDRLRALGARVVWIAPPTMPFPDRGVRAMVASTGFELFPSDQMEIPRGPDGIHPTAAGFAAWAGLLWRWIGG